MCPKQSKRRPITWLQVTRNTTPDEFQSLCSTVGKLVDILSHSCLWGWQWNEKMLEGLAWNLVQAFMVSIGCTLTSSVPSISISELIWYINYLCFLLVVNVPVPSCCSLLVWEQQMYKFSQDHLSQRKMLFLAVWFEAGRAAVDSARSSVTAEMTLINWNNKKEQGRRWVAKQRAEKTANIGELNHFKKGAKINEKDGIWSADAGWSNMTADVGFPDITQHKAADEAEMSSELDLTACLN